MDKSGSSPDDAIDAICQACSAVNYPHAKRCWMCGAPFVEGLRAQGAVVKGTVAKGTVGSTPPDADLTIPITIAVVCGVAAIVGLGCFAQSSLLGTAYFIVVIPGLVCAFLGAALFRKKGAQASASSALVGFGVGVSAAALFLVLSIVVAFMIVASALAAFFQACGELLGAPG